MTPARQGHSPPWLALLVLADLLFFPRLLFAFGIPVSLLIVAGALARRRFDALAALAALSVVTVAVTSVAAASITGDNPTPIESLKRALQLGSILVYALYRVDLEAIRAGLVVLLRCFYLYVSCAALLFYVDPDLYQTVLTAVYPEALDALPDNLIFFRFPYVFEDPNSAAYFLAMTLVVYVAVESDRRWAFACATLATLAVLGTQSRGGYIALVLIFGHRLWVSEAPRRVKVRTVVALAAVAAVLAVIYSEEIANAYTVFDSRFQYEDDLGGGRAGKYGYFLENFNLLPFGAGYHLQRDGIEFRPHSDLIRLDLAYGIVGLSAILYFVLPRRRSQALLFAVFLIPFLINTVIDDYRLFPMYLILLALLGQLEPRVRRRRPAAVEGAAA